MRTANEVTREQGRRAATADTRTAVKGAVRSEIPTGGRNLKNATVIYPRDRKNQLRWKVSIIDVLPMSDGLDCNYVSFTVPGDDDSVVTSP